MYFTKWTALDQTYILFYGTEWTNGVLYGRVLLHVKIVVRVLMNSWL